MPSYEYECTSCGKVTTLLLPIKLRNNLYICQCGAKTKRILSKFSTVASVRSAQNMDVHQTSKKTSNAKISESAAIRLDGKVNLTLKDNLISGCDVGVSISEGGKVNMKGNKFFNVRKPIEIRGK